MARASVRWSAFRRNFANLGYAVRNALHGVPLIALSATPTPSTWTTIRECLCVRPDAVVSRGTI